MQEAGPTTSDWQPVATDITTPDFTINQLSPRKDYNFRIRAEMENGDISEPTPPILYYRSRLPMAKEPFTLGEYKPVAYEVTLANRTYVEHLTKYVPPRLPIDKPEMVVINPETVELAWKPARVPESIRYSSNLTYTIEVRTPPSFEWRELVSGLKQLNHTVKKLHPRIDYIFRIRAWNEYGPSEPSLPVSLYRPVQHDVDVSYEEDEAFEKDWELRFGQQGETPLKEVPPKLPMDTPKIITQSPESIWFSWIPARIPAYATQTPITYVIEIKEPPETSWKRAEERIVDCQYTYEGMNPARDYHIRVRAESKFGPSEPTLPIIIKRSGSRPGSRRSSLERDMKTDGVGLDTTALETLTSGVPPRMSSNRPLSSNVQPTSLTLSWPAGRVPSYVKNQTISYIIEKREPPGHIWTVLAKDIPGTKYDIKGLNADQDYLFRVRAKNDYGTSEPTLPMTLYRERDDYVPQKIRSRSGSRDSIQALVSRRRLSSSFLDFDYPRAGSEEVDICVKDQIPTQPEYTSAPKWDTQYGIEGKKGKIILQVRGYPLPTVHWYLNDEKLDYGDNYNAFVSPSGTVTLEIKMVKQDTMGTYKCYAENEHGSAVKFVKYEYADPPTVLEPLHDLVLTSHTSGKFTCRVDGFPCPTAKWMKDWHLVKDSTRVKVLYEAPDRYSLEITNALSSDSGLYACTMENVAGKVTMTARLVIEDQEPGPVEVELKKSPIEDSYHILEEIGRSRQGVIRRVIEKQTGESFAANFIFARNKAQKDFFMTEFEILRLLNQYDDILKLHDAFETERSLVLVTELLSGSDLLDKVIMDGSWTEANAAETIKNLLAILQILGAHSIQHLDFKPSNIYLCGAEGKDMKLINFALSRQLVADEDLIHNYGSIGYASPEQVAEDVITERTDVWAVGVLAYILLAGESPFKGANDFEVLNKTKTCDWEFSEAFASFSEEAKDFISKLLSKNPSERLSVDDSLKHPWLTTTSATKLNNEKLKLFYEEDKKKREANKCFITANLQSFNKILHGASALYQPAMDQDSGEIIFPDTEEYGDFLSEDAWYEWQLHYMDDPDTQNFPLENKDFTVRESRHTSADDEMKKDKKESESDIDSAIMFRNKIKATSFIVGEDVTLTCTVISPNSPAIVTWYRDEQLLGEDTYRTEASYNDETGEASLTITNLKDYDAAIYKCVARNKDGRVSCEARLLLGDVPGMPSRPVITQTSGSEVFLTWTGPVSNGNSYILGYRIDYKKTDEEKWTRGPFVTDEYALVSGLLPSSEYIFRVSSHNKYGASQYSWSSLPVTTGNVDTPKIEIAKYLKPILQFSSYDKQQLILQAASRRPSMTVVADAKLKEGKPEDNYNILETISKGRYGEYKLCSSIVDNKHYVMKIMPFTADSKDIVMHEFSILSNLRQVNIITAFESFISGETFYVIFERLSGINVLQYLCLRKFYSEEVVSRIVQQILDGLQYLQQLGVVHLNLQPSSVVMATRRRLHVKLRDFTHAQKLEDGKDRKMSPVGYPDFIAPEILRGEPAGFPADVWGLGALTFVLLSGTSSFCGTDRQDTLNRILFDRYSVSDMYDNVSKEAISFVTKMLKRLPKNRTTVNKCLDSKWLQLSDSMIKLRNSHLFRTETLRDFAELYQERRADSQYMDLSGVSEETLAKPTVGPQTEPILSKRLPKLFRPIAKPSPDSELDISSAETIASDFRSVLDKIEKLKDALDSGAELPERKTSTRKDLSETSEFSITSKGNIKSDKSCVLKKAVPERSVEDSKSFATETEAKKMLQKERETDSKESANKAEELSKLDKGSVEAFGKQNETLKDSKESFAMKANEIDTTVQENGSELKGFKENIEKSDKMDAKAMSEKEMADKLPDRKDSNGADKAVNNNKAKPGSDTRAESGKSQSESADKYFDKKDKKLESETDVKMDKHHPDLGSEYRSLKPSNENEIDKPSMKFGTGNSEIETVALSATNDNYDKQSIEEITAEGKSILKEVEERKQATSDKDIEAKSQPDLYAEQKEKEKAATVQDEKKSISYLPRKTHPDETDEKEYKEKSLESKSKKDRKETATEKDIPNSDEEKQNTQYLPKASIADDKKITAEKTEEQQQSVHEDRKIVIESIIPKEEEKQNKPTQKEYKSVKTEQDALQEEQEQMTLGENTKNAREEKQVIISLLQQSLEEDQQNPTDKVEVDNQQQLPMDLSIKKDSEMSSPEEEQQTTVSTLQLPFGDNTSKVVGKILPEEIREEPFALMEASLADSTKTTTENSVPIGNEKQQSVLERDEIEDTKEVISKDEGSKNVCSEEDQAAKITETQHTRIDSNSAKRDEKKGDDLKSGHIETTSVDAEPLLMETLETKPETHEDQTETVEDFVMPVAVVKDKSMPEMKKDDEISSLSETKQETNKKETEIVEDTVMPVTVIKDNSVPEMKIHDETPSKIETKQGTSETEIEIVEDTVMPIALIKDKSVPEMKTLSKALQEIDSAGQVIEEIIQAETAKKENSLPDLDYKVKLNNQQKTPPQQNKEEKSEEMVKSDVNLNASTLKSDTQTEKIESESRSDSKTQLDNNGKEVQNNKDLSIHELTKANDSVMESDMADNTIDTVSKTDRTECISEVVEKYAQELSKRVNDLLEGEKRSSVSTISTESEYLDALSCCENKDLKCNHNHESTPDSVYATPDRDIEWRNSVDEENQQAEAVEMTENREESPQTEKITEKLEITEKSDTEAVKESDSYIQLNKKKTDEEDKKTADDILKTDRDGSAKEKNKLSAEIVQMADQMVTEAMGDALKVAEKSE